jgi:RNA polymerase sigma-70 factor (ECF subfamily)
VLKAWRAFEQLEPGTNAKAWLFQILKNTSRNDWRRRASRPDEVSLEHPVGGPTGGEWSLGDLLVGSSDDPEALVEAVLARADVEEALARLPQAFREVVQLCLVEGFRYHEAAAILGVPEGTVMSRLHRGRRQLQETLLERALELGIVPAGGAASSVAA